MAAKNITIFLLLALGAYSTESLVLKRGDNEVVLPDPEIGLRKIVIPRLTPFTVTYYFTTFTATYNDAVDYCASTGTGMHLLMIKDHLKEAEIKEAIAADGTHEDRWLWLDYNAPDWIWGDGKRAIFTNFYESTSTSTFKHYVEGTSSAPFLNKWRYTSQDERLHFVCEKLEGSTSLV